MSLLAAIYLAGGCFWGVEEYFSRIPGVTATEAGYAQSNIPNPDYRAVCSGGTGAAETVKIEYDPDKIPLSALISQYFKIIDPLSVNRQGNDVGAQYRTGIYYVNPADKAELQTLLDKESQRLGRPLAVELEPLRNFYPAEEYHQAYLKKNPGGYCHISFDSLKDLDNLKKGPPARDYKKPDDAALRSALSPMEYHVTQENGTEPAFSGRYWDNHEPGLYVDAVSGEPLFISSDKFDSGSGWPSFTKPLSPDAVSVKEDLSHGMRRIEVRSSRADSHLGHVFPDGPASAGGLRYCINSAALRFIPEKDMEREGYGSFLKLMRGERR